MKPSMRRKRALLAERRTNHTLMGRWRRYGCTCGRHNMAERDWWLNFFQTPTGEKWSERYPD